MEDEYAKLIRRMNPPRVVIDNASCEHATVIEVDGINRHGILLEVIQVLTDLNLQIIKAYISSDGGWFMDVLHVTHHNGNKIIDVKVLNYMQQTLESVASFLNSLRHSVGVMPSKEHTSVELIGADRPGLLSELSAVLTSLRCNVVNAEIWTHNARAAAIIHITDETTQCAIEDPKRLSMIKELLINVLRGNGNLREPKLTISSTWTIHKQRRLHQLMLADRDFENLDDCKNLLSRPQITVLDCKDREYTAVILRSKDRPKLVFDTICSLTDMQYMVFHGTVITGRMEAYQEYYIRHIDGLPMGSEAERQRVKECLEAAIERRASEGIELELCTEDRIGLLSDVTRIFRENGLYIRQAEVTTKGGNAKDSFFVTGVSGGPVETKNVDFIKGQIGQGRLLVKGNLNVPMKLPQESARSFLFGNFFRGRTFQNF